MSAHLDPPDDATGPACSWCSDDPRPTAFCSKACEDASHEANAEPNDEEGGEQRHRVNLERELAYVARHEEKAREYAADMRATCREYAESKGRE